MAQESNVDNLVVMERRRTKDRRQAERRTVNSAVENERRQGRQRRKVARRRQIDPTTCERAYTAEEIEFMTALDRYKRENGRQFPTCSEILEVLHGLGYRRDNPSAVDTTVATV